MNRTCSMCDGIFPSEHFHYGRRPNRSYCQVCNRGDKRARNEALKEGRDPIEAARAYKESRRGAGAVFHQTPSPAPIE